MAAKREYLGLGHAAWLLMLIFMAPALARGACPDGTAGLTLPAGFCATVFARGLGHVRHMAVAADGTLYANTWSGDYYPGSPPPPGGFLLALQSKGGGKADRIRRFGPTPAGGGSGGTGIGLYHGALYAQEGSSILRYALTPGSPVPQGKPQIVVSGLPLSGDHPMHPFIIAPDGTLYIDVASATNSCQPDNRAPEVPGAKPCLEKRTRAGIWRYDATKTHQAFSAAARYASGIRNGDGFGFDSAGRLFVVNQGRDQLYQDWPHLYTAAQSANQPSEELLLLRQGADYGWPECYYDPAQGRLVLAPEYGGDGGKATGPCGARTPPVAVFPAHWAPDDMLIYHGAAFPAPYRGGVFIAFHGSWNRAPLPQGGYNIGFQPMKDGKPAGPFIVFADGFAGAHKSPGQATHRPAGLAEGPDGALYVSDDEHGWIWRITYTGTTGTSTASGAGGAAPQKPQSAASGAAPGPSLSPPPGVSAAERRWGAGYSTARRITEPAAAATAPMAKAGRRGRRSITGIGA